jgi:hypothetical protein
MFKPYWLIWRSVSFIIPLIIIIIFYYCFAYDMAVLWCYCMICAAGGWWMMCIMQLCLSCENSGAGHSDKLLVMSLLSKRCSIPSDDKLVDTCYAKVTMLLEVVCLIILHWSCIVSYISAKEIVLFLLLNGGRSCGYTKCFGWLACHLSWE